jgi:SAM-dependent methyltransferase
MISSPYTVLAENYDYIIKHVDYQSWFEYIKSVMLKYCNNPNIVVELGTGTGKFGAKFSAAGYNIYGIDKSIDILRVAKRRAFGKFRLICSDMSAFYLKPSADFIFSVHDTMNYFLKKSDIVKVFKSVASSMKKESIFMFDITTEYNILNNFHEKTSVYKIKEVLVEWNNLYNKRKRIVQSVLHFSGSDGSSQTEVHYQRIYEVKEILKLLNKCGFEVLGVFGDHTFDEPNFKTIMINFVTRLKRK